MQLLLKTYCILPIRFEPGTYLTEVTSVTAASNRSVTLGVIHSYRSGEITSELNARPKLLYSSKGEDMPISIC
jgi:hypothetical protein